MNSSCSRAAHLYVLTLSRLSLSSIFLIALTESAAPGGVVGQIPDLFGVVVLGAIAVLMVVGLGVLSRVLSVATGPGDLTFLNPGDDIASSISSEIRSSDRLTGAEAWAGNFLKLTNFSYQGGMAR